MVSYVSLYPQCLALGYIAVGARKGIREESLSSMNE